MRLGLFGGTFDPPHIGHLIVAQDALEALDLDRVLFIPAGIPPHKANQRVTPADVRLEMLKAAIGSDPRFGIETMELERAGPSYSVDTVAALSARYTGAELFFLIGADQFRDLNTWREPARLAGMATITVLSRGGAETADSAMAGVEVRYVNVTRIDLSSTAVRTRAAAGGSLRYVVPAAVEAYIAEHHVYDR